MPDIEASKVKLPSGTVVILKDAYARERIAALESGSFFLGVTSTALVNNSTTNPIVIDGVSVTAVNGNIVIYNNLQFIFNGTKWIEFGDMSSLGALATKSTVALNKGNGDNVLGEATTFAVTQPTIALNPTMRTIKATVTDAALGNKTREEFVKAYGSPSTAQLVAEVDVNRKLLEKTTVPNVTRVTPVPLHTFQMGTGDEAETLIIGIEKLVDASASKVTLGLPIHVATGNFGADTTDTDPDGIITTLVINKAAAITSLGNPTTALGLTDVGITTQPAVRLVETSDAAQTGQVSLMKTASPTASGAAVTANGNDTVKVAKFGDLSVSVS